MSALMPIYPKPLRTPQKFIFYHHSRHYMRVYFNTWKNLKVCRVIKHNKSQIVSICISLK